MSKRASLRIFFASLTALGLLCSMIACGGGGGDVGSDRPLSNNSCNVLGTKIFSGTECSNARDIPIAAVLIKARFTGTELCSGTLIGPRQVLTAGHCLQERTGEVSVILGGVTYLAVSAVVHPGYSESQELGAIFNDVAVLTLAENVPGLTPLAISIGQPTVTGEIINIFGYGVDEAHSLGVLRSGQMLLTDVTLNHLSALFRGEGSNTCQGDSGGPALLDGSNPPLIVGITSTGTPDARCQPGDNSLFVNLQNPSISAFIAQQAPGAVFR